MDEKITCIIDADPEVDHAVWLWNATDGRKMLALGQAHEMYTSHRHVLVRYKCSNCMIVCRRYSVDFCKDSSLEFDSYNCISGKIYKNMRITQMD